MSELPLNKELSLQFGSGEKQDFERLIREIREFEKDSPSSILDDFANSSSPAWARYSQAIYNHPKTWWIGLLHLSMLSGVWGARYRRAASIRQSVLSQTIKRYFAIRPADKRLHDAEQLVRFNLKYHKADVMGRLHGGLFTNYAATGGVYGRRLSKGVTMPAAAVNFTIASFGACIEAVAKGYRTYGAVAQAILTGKPENVSEVELFNHSIPSPPDVDSKISGEALLAQVVAIDYLNDTSSGPVPISEFCARPENQNLEEVCG